MFYFPYVLDQLPQIDWDRPEIESYKHAMIEQATLDNRPESESLSDYVRWQMSIDRKHKSLKDFQGFVWREGYASGQLEGVVYPDVVEFMKKTDLPIYIYSSGSVSAQKLLFGHSDHGNLLPFIKGYYDTNIGLKGEKSSYVHIARDIGMMPEEILFLSDIQGEVEAVSIDNLNR